MKYVFSNCTRDYLKVLWTARLALVGDIHKFEEDSKSREQEGDHVASKKFIFLKEEAEALRKKLLQSTEEVFHKENDGFKYNDMQFPRWNDIGQPIVCKCSGCSK